MLALNFQIPCKIFINYEVDQATINRPLSLVRCHFDILAYYDLQRIKVFGHCLGSAQTTPKFHVKILLIIKWTKPL